MNILVRLLVNAVALAVAAWLIPGITLDEGATNTDRAITLAIVAAIFGLVNALIRPVVKLLALPLIILTLGLITFVINALMLLLTSWITDEPRRRVPRRRVLARAHRRAGDHGRRLGARRDPARLILIRSGAPLRRPVDDAEPATWRRVHRGRGRASSRSTRASRRPCSRPA